MQTIKTTYYGILLAFIALICTALSMSVYFLTKNKIDTEIEKQQQAQLSEIIPINYYDNDLLSSCSNIDDNALTDYIERVCIAKKDNHITAYAFESITSEGYAGKIRLIVGLTPEGKVLGVRVIEHQETPGLGDKIERRISDWILSFTNKQIDKNNLSDWAVRKDGGKFDQFAGATITPRAVVNQVKRSSLAMLEYIKKQEKNKQRIEK